jgi:succinoglycan biosynthesis transport protein ExoP
VSPNRYLIFFGGLFLSIGLACAHLWILEKTDTSVRGRVDLLNLTGVPPLALVPYIDTEAEHRAARRHVRLAIGTAMATVVGAVVAIHFFFRPLDVLWFTLARKIGL